MSLAVACLFVQSAVSAYRKGIGMQNNMTPNQQKVEMMKQIFRILLRNGYSLQFPRYMIMDEEVFDSLQENDIFEMFELFQCERYIINTKNKFITGV